MDGVNSAKFSFAKLKRLTRIKWNIFKERSYLIFRQIKHRLQHPQQALVDNFRRDNLNLVLAHEDQFGVGRTRGAEVRARVGHGDRIRVAAALCDVDSLHEVPKRELHLMHAVDEGEVRRSS